MKQGKLIPTHNVLEANRCISELQRRPKLEMVGLGLVYGAPGLGKTTWATRTALRENYIYLRLEATTTAKNFSKTLLRTLSKSLGYGDIAVAGSAHDLFQRSVNLLALHPHTVILIDEIDYGFRNPLLLGAIRDIVDETLAIVILVGMENAMERLLQINRYYFDRCSQFYQFLPCSLKDLSMVATSILEIKMDEDVVRYIHRVSGGNLRQAIKVMDSMESLALAKNLSTITMKDLGG
ncbi:MAG: ATP-binding protein [Candidatus Cloacimonetes bacterium]|nr:ATP-binding protein [Candidatus Cloacimonadota bacterium]